jgi:hypothetical protein
MCYAHVFAGEIPELPLVRSGWVAVGLRVGGLARGQNRKEVVKGRIGMVCRVMDWEWKGSIYEIIRYIGKMKQYGYRVN